MSGSHPSDEARNEALRQALLQQDDADFPHRALHASIVGGHARVVLVLLDYYKVLGLNFLRQGLTTNNEHRAFALAVAKNNKQIVSILLEYYSYFNDEFLQEAVQQPPEVMRLEPLVFLPEGKYPRDTRHQLLCITMLHRDKELLSLVLDCYRKFSPQYRRESVLSLLPVAVKINIDSLPDLLNYCLVNNGKHLLQECLQQNNHAVLREAARIASYEKGSPTLRLVLELYFQNFDTAFLLRGLSANEHSVLLSVSDPSFVRRMSENLRAEECVASNMSLAASSVIQALPTHQPSFSLRDLEEIKGSLFMRDQPEHMNRSLIQDLYLKAGNDFCNQGMKCYLGACSGAPTLFRDDREDADIFFDHRVDYFLESDDEGYDDEDLADSYSRRPIGCAWK